MSKKHKLFKVDKRTPSLSEDLNAYKNTPFNWTINTTWLCNEGDYCLKKSTLEDIFYIFAKLDCYRSWSWKDIETNNGTSCGAMEISKLDEKEIITKHLQKCKLDEHDILYKMEISGRHRVWGIRIGSNFYIIWNDKNHQFYKPQHKNYTKPKPKPQL